MSDFKQNPQTGNWEAQQDGIYEREADDPADRVRMQFRKGQVVTEADAHLFKRAGGWPAEPTAEDEEAAATAKQSQPPENKAAPAPKDK